MPKIQKVTSPTRALDLLGRKWTLRILWELRAGLLTFRGLRERAGNPSPTLLNGRLHELVEAGIVDRSDGEGYMLTSAGEELAELLSPLTRWSERWLRGGDDARAGRNLAR